MTSPASQIIYVFGDQTLPVHEGLQALVLVKDNHVLQGFLGKALSALQDEISALPATERGLFPQTESLGMLLEAVRKGPTHTALESAILCIHQLAHYINSVTHDWIQHPPTQPVFLLGLCTGSLAAAAISCSDSIFDLVELGTQAVIAGFRLGIQIYRRGLILGGPQLGSWSAVISSTNEEQVADVIKRYRGNNHLPLSLQPYISAIGPTSVSVSGLPKVLDEFLSLGDFSTNKTLRVPILGPYHAADVYSPQDVEKVLSICLKNLRFLDRSSQLPILSCASAGVLARSTFDGTLRELITSIVTEKVRIDSVIDAIDNVPARSTTSKPATTLVPFHTQVLPTLAAALRAKGMNVQQAPEASGTASAGGLAPDASDADKIAIIGFSGRFPEADGVGEFWDLLQKGLDVHKPIPGDRFDVNTHYDPKGKRKNTSQVQFGCWLKDASQFDAKFFHLSPREACQTDPAQRLALLTSYEALEMAGFIPDRTPSSQRNRVGVYYGTTSNDWGEVNSSQNIGTYYIPGANRAFIPGRINYFFKFSGPSVAVDTACSSSLAALDIAISSLLNRDCDTAVAGGTNVLTNPDNFAGLDRGHFLSRTGNCNTFDNDADGYCRADGVGTVVMKRLSDAIADNDPIFGVVLGAQTNHSAESVSITRPLADAQEYLFKKLLNEAGLHPHDVGYIEMHGTGTQAGDAVEMRSVLNTFAWDFSRPADKRLYLGSVKSNVGHGESASGVTALIKVLLMMQKNKIPPHCGIKGKINQGFPTDLDQRRVHIALGREAEWPRPLGTRRRAFVNNFSAAGGNTAMLLEDAPLASTAPAGARDPRAKHVVTVSARSAESLRRNLLAMAEYVAEISAPELLSQVSYTTTARRMHHNRRVAIVTDGLQHLRQSLLDAAARGDVKPVSDSNPHPVGFLFTGQGAQETAMARGFYDHFPSFRADIVDFDAIARLQELPSVLPLVDGSVPVEHLSPTVVQLGSCIVQIALARLWINFGAKPQYVIGHSLGEFAALHVAGVLSISDAIYLCGRRAAILEHRCKPGTHGMLVIMASESDVRQVIIGTSLGIACVNGPEDTVVSGPATEIDAVCESLRGVGYKFHKLALPYAFHSSQVDPILDELEDLSRHIDFQPPEIPILSPVTGTVVESEGVFGANYIRRHCRETVNFLGAVKAGLRHGLFHGSGVCVEIGPHALLTRMMKNIAPHVQCYTSLRRGEDCFKTLPETLSALYLAGVPINWDEYHRSFPACQRVIGLPSYAWDLDSYWMQYQYDWCLTKGDAPVATTAPAPTELQFGPARLSDSVHDIIQQSHGYEKSSLVAQSDFHDPALWPVAEQHRVNGLTLCPSTLYSDLAYTASKHLLDHRFKGSETYMPDICDMVAEKALIVSNEGSQIFRASLEVDWTCMRGSMEIYSVDNQGKKTTVHARCNVEFHNPETYHQHWRRRLYLIERSIQRLEQGVADGSVHKMGHGMIYRLFSSAVQYGPRYQGIQEVMFDSEGLEATAKVYQPPGDEHFALNTFCCDSLGHISGFVMNSSDHLDSDHIYVNHGWKRMRFSEPYLPGVSYQTYIKMQPLREDDSVYAGDLHVLRAGQIIGVCEDVTFQKVPRKVLQMLLPSPSKSGNKPGGVKVPAPVHPTSKTTTSAPAPVSSTSSSTLQTPPDSPGCEPSGITSLDVVQQALQVVADEMGVEIKLLKDDAEFADFGVDSLMSLTILGTLREDLNLDVPASLFIEYPTVKSLKAFLQKSTLPELSVATPPSSVSSRKASIASLAASACTLNIPPSTSVILQGTKRATKTLFLFPDGAGSATSYVTLPKISDDLRVYGLNSPYLKNPQDFQCALGDITDSYIAEIRRRQPRGPYHLAGWSAGGVSAFDAAQKLVGQGEAVESLIFIDSPNPVGLGKLPPKMYTFLENSGVFGAFEPSGGGGGGTAAPDWLFQHFLVFIEALDKYRPVPFEPRSAPRTTIIWAEDGVCKEDSDPRPEAHPDDPRGLAWLLENRTDFGPNGWDEFLGRENITTHAIKNANHFTMMREPVAAAVVELVREVLGVDTGSPRGSTGATV